MKYRFSDYQFDGELDNVRLLVEASLGIILSERDSSYWYGTYFAFKDNVSDFRLKLYRNVDPSGDWIVKEFEGAKIVCSLSGPVKVVESFDAKMQASNAQLLKPCDLEIDDE